MRRLPSTRGAIVGLALIGLIGGAREAGAQRIGAVVVSSSQPAIDAVALAAALAAAGVDDADVLMTAARARRAGTVPASALARFTTVGHVVAEGWRAYLAADPAFASARLAVARNDAEALLTVDGGTEVYADVSLRLGIVLTHLGQAEAATEALRLAHALDPARPVTAAEFSPDAVAAYQAAIAATVARAEIRIDALAGAEVAIDGVVIGPAPLTTTVAVGEHVVVVRRAGYQARGLAVAVTGRAPLLAIELDPDRGAAAVGAASRDGVAALSEVEAAAAIDEVLTYAEVDAVEVIASVVRAGAPALLGQRCVGGRACTAVVEIGYPDAAGLAGAIALLHERLARADRRYGVILPTDPRLTRGERGVVDGGCRSCRRWYWIGGGVVVTAVVAAVVVAATSGAAAPVVTIDPGDFTR